MLNSTEGCQKNVCLIVTLFYAVQRDCYIVTHLAEPSHVRVALEGCLVVE
jgi:hypothetical protein